MAFTDEANIRSYLHSDEYNKDEEKGITCCHCGCTIPSQEKYYSILDYCYCKDCLDDCFSKYV